MCKLLISQVGHEVYNTLTLKKGLSSTPSSVSFRAASGSRWWSVHIFNLPSQAQAVGKCQDVNNKSSNSMELVRKNDQLETLIIQSIEIEETLRFN